MSTPILAVKDLYASYGKVRAVRGVSLEVHAGQMVCMIGANGAGKSTTLNTLVGLHRAAEGSVWLDGERVTSLPAYRRARKGIALVPEGRMIVSPLTVEANLNLSGFARRGELDERLKSMYDLFPPLADRSNQLAGTLSGGEQQMLALARAVATNPRVLLLDEPSMGLAPAVVERVVEAIVEIHRSGVAVLLVEQNATLALRISDHAYVLQRGEVLMSGPAAELRESAELVSSAYLG